MRSKKKSFSSWITSLNYGAIDIILTPEGKHVFLELNPAGEFFWLERAPGLPISDAIADLLLSPPRIYLPTSPPPRC